MSDPVSFIKSSGGDVDAQIAPGFALIPHGNVTETDFNEVMTAGSYYVNNPGGMDNRPTENNGILVVFQVYENDTDLGGKLQMYFENTSHKIHYRSRSASAWRPWHELYNNEEKPMTSNKEAVEKNGKIVFNDMIESGIWYVYSNSEWENGPDDGNPAISGILVVFSAYGNTDEVIGGKRQVYFQSDHSVYTRIITSEGWKEWTTFDAAHPLPVVQGSSSPVLFSIDLSQPSNDDIAIMDGYNASNQTDDGYAPDGGWDDLVTISRYVVCDDVAYAAEIELSSASSGSVALGTKSADYATSDHATIVRFDFSSGKMDFMAGADGGGNYDGSTLPPYVYESVNMSNVSGTSYRVEIGRRERCPYAKVVNLTTSQTCAEKVLEEYATTESYGGKAGTLYDFPTFAVLSGGVTFKRISCVIPCDPLAVFVGDSITQGSQVAFSDCWAKKAADYLGNSVTMGRGGGTIDHVIDALQDIAYTMRPKYVFVTIGTNGGNTPSKLNQVLELIKGMGATPIVNCISMLQTSVSSINNQILDLPCLHIRFDIATAIGNNPPSGQNTSLFNSDLVHPNEQGHEAMFNAFLAAAGWIKVGSQQ